MGYWRCVCECGKEKVISRSNLKYGNSQRCSLRCMKGPNDMSGRVFGKLTVVESAGGKPGKREWKCLCECGNYIVTETNRLTGKTKTSCGCEDHFQTVLERKKKYIGRRFGMLTVLDVGTKRATNGWLCQCDCGNRRVFPPANLMKHAKSCGCVSMLPRGEGHHRWDPSLSVTEREKKRGCSENTKWRNDVFERDDYTCQITGKRGSQYIEAHHLDAWHTHPDVRFEVSNGVTLSKVVHNLFHLEYGRTGHTTRIQFEEFKRRCQAGEFESVIKMTTLRM
jgi:hypothetical protein